VPLALARDGDGDGDPAHHTREGVRRDVGRSGIPAAKIRVEDLEGGRNFRICLMSG